MTVAEATQVYRVYIKATPEAIFEAITSPEWTNRYGYGNYAEFDLPIIDGLAAVLQIRGRD